MHPIESHHSADPFISKNTVVPYSQGVLSGLSFAVKDNIDVAGEMTGYGSPGWAATQPEPVVNAICLEQLLDEGSTYKGKTKSDELAYSLLGVNSFSGTPLNPKVPERVPGGSSSGSASAVAGELVDFALGTDTGGSIRVSASNCGVWGYRPSHGSISVSGVLGLAPSFDTVGILARTGAILEKVMQVLLAEAERKERALPVVCLVDDVFAVSDRRIVEGVASTLDTLSKRCRTKRIKLAEITASHVNTEWLFALLGFLLSTEIWNTFGAWVKNDRPRLSLGVEHSLREYAESADRRQIQARLREKKIFQNGMNWFLEQGNILCFPTTVDIAPRVEEVTPEFYQGAYIPRAMGVNALSTLSSTPQISIPVAEIDGIPIGLSFLAAEKHDMSLVRFCRRAVDR